MRVLFAAVAAVASTGVALARLPGAAARFASPQQPYVSADGQVRLLRPLTARVSASDAPEGALMSPGWRLVWDGAPPRPGRLEVRLSLPVVPLPPQTRRVEHLQVGVSRDPAAVRGCLSPGLAGDGVRRADRVINGRRFAVATHGDAGMSQQISATDLRTVVDGACYAVERFSYGDSASARDPAVTLPQAQGAAMMDAALASLQLGRVAPGAVKRAPGVRLPPHAVAY